MSWHPVLTKIAALKIQLRCAKTRAAARQEFDDFVAGNPSDEDMRLASLYYAQAIYDLEGWR
jgi:hypothetical protein